MKAVKICDNIYWVGAIDWDLRNFHGYLTQKGSTYNAYLIIDEKITLIDTVKYYKKDELIERISSIIEPEKIDTIIVNHVEMDHSGSLPDIMKICPNAEIVTSPNGMKGLKEHYKKDWNFKIVKSGDKLQTGKYSFDFLLTPMVHWPDNMVTYCQEQKILFSNDAFGQHIASTERFDKNSNIETVIYEAAKYYANIVLPYGVQVNNVLKTIENMELEINCIAPSHGIIWEKHIAQIMEEYKKWANNEVNNKALIIYDTMWDSTKKVAYAIQDCFEDNNIRTKIFDLKYNHISDIMTEVLNAEYICVGSPTLNNNVLPTVASFLTYMKGLSPKKRKGVAFGSYGWGGQSIGHVNDALKEMGFELCEPLKVKYIPDKAILDNEIIKLKKFICGD
jgi:flavorubredoxin